MNWRLNEGNDEAIYQIGVEDDGNPLGLSEAELDESLWNLSRMATAVGCSLHVDQIFIGHQGFTAKVLLKRLERQLILTIPAVQIHVALLGDTDTGKSTVIGVLSCESGTLDNGRGSARMQVAPCFNYTYMYTQIICLSSRYGIVANRLFNIIMKLAVETHRLYPSIQYTMTTLDRSATIFHACSEAC